MPSWRSPIECTDLRKTYDGKVEAVRGLSLRIEAGECFGLLGPNGAGKTTTIEILEGLLAPTAGEVRIFGHTWADNPRQLREWIGISLQDTRLSEKLSVRETIELFASFYSEPRPSSAVLEELAAHGKSRRLGWQAFRRPETAPRRCHRAGWQSAHSFSRRAHHRTRSPKPPPALGHRSRLPEKGRDRSAHHSLHGRSRAALRPPGHCRSWPDHRRGKSARLDRPSRRTSRRRVRSE